MVTINKNPDISTHNITFDVERFKVSDVFDECGQRYPVYREYVVKSTVKAVIQNYAEMLNDLVIKESNEKERQLFLIHIYKSMLD